MKQDGVSAFWRVAMLMRSDKTSDERTFLLSLAGAFERLLLAACAVAPLIIAYVVRLAGSDHIWPSLWFHRALTTGLLVACAFSAFLAHETHKGSREPLLRFVSLAFAGFAATDLFSALLAPSRSFLLFGPAARLVFASYILGGLTQIKREDGPRVSPFWPHFAAFVAIDGILLFALPLEALGVDALRQRIEGAAMVVMFLDVGLTLARRVWSPLIDSSLVAFIILAQSSFAFLIARPWDPMWWLANIVSTAGLLLLSHVLIRSYHTTQSLERSSTHAELYSNLQAHARELGEWEARYRNLFDSIGDAVLVTDPESRIVDTNHAFGAMFGYASEEITGLSTSCIYAMEGEFTAVGHALATLDGDSPLTRSLSLRRKGSLVFPGEATIAKLKDSSGQCVGYLVLLRDVTERKELELELRQGQKMEAVGRLAGGIAHDFNNLLSIILGYGNLLLEHLDDGAPARRQVEEIVHAGERAAVLTRQLLAFSRKQVLQPKILNLNLIVVNMEKILRRLIGEHLHLVTLMQDDLGWTKADPGQVEQIIMNLAVNARDAMRGGGRLTIETANVDLDSVYVAEHPGATAGAHVMLRVSDTGHGMDAETRAHIFEPFFTTKEQGKGTGLGLATVYGIVKQSGGYIWVESEAGYGATFRVYLPRAPEPAEPVAETAQRRPLPIGSETILLVEDEAGLRHIARDILAGQGYCVLEAPSGHSALQISEGHTGPIHLLLTDVVMPGMSGRQLAEHVVKMRPATRVLFMSGYTDDTMVHHRVLEPGAAFLAKPFTLDAIARKVREVLDTGR